MSVRYDPVRIDGILYLNPVQAAEALGLSKNAIYVQLSRHPEMSFEDIIRAYLDKSKNRIGLKQVEYNGVVYESVLDACSMLGLNHNTIYYRMRSNPNLTFQEAVDYNRQTQGKLNGSGVGVNLSNYCREKGLDYRKMYKLTSSGMTLQQAEDKLNEGESTEFMYNGVAYRSLLDACMELELKYPTAYNKMKVKGWTFKETIDYLINKRKNKLNS